MSKTIAYTRVSTSTQDLQNQKLEILEYADKNQFHIDEWLQITVSSRKSVKDRLIDQLLEKLDTGDTLVVSELSRLGRSVSQIITIIDTLIKKTVKVIVIKQRMTINGQNDIQTKVMITMFSLFAEIERDLISERTKNGIARARTEGKLIGRPRGNGKSKLDCKRDEIIGLLEKSVSKASIAKMLNVSPQAIQHFVKTRGLAPNK